MLHHEVVIHWLWQKCIIWIHLSYVHHVLFQIPCYLIISLSIRNWWKNGSGTCSIRCVLSHNMWIVDICHNMSYMYSISRPTQICVPGGFWPFGQDEPRVIDASLAQLCHTGVDLQCHLQCVWWQDSKVFQLRYPGWWIPLEFTK